MNINTATDEALDHFAELLLKKIDGSFSSDERSYHEKTYGLVEAEMEKRWMKKKAETAGEPSAAKTWTPADHVEVWNGPLPDHALEDFRKRLEAKNVEIDRLNRMIAENKKYSDEKNAFIVAYRARIDKQFAEIDRLNRLVEVRGEVFEENERLKSNIEALDRATSDLRIRYGREHDSAMKTIRELEARLADADKKTESTAKTRHLWMVEDGPHGHGVWTKVGLAFENKDGSTHVELPPGLFHTKKETP